MFHIQLKHFTKRKKQYLFYLDFFRVALFKFFEDHFKKICGNSFVFHSDETPTTHGHGFLGAHR